MFKRVSIIIFPMFCVIVMAGFYYAYNSQNYVVEDLSQRPGYQEFEKVDKELISEVVSGNDRLASELSENVKAVLKTKISGNPFWDDLQLDKMQVYCHHEGEYLMVLAYIPGVMNYSNMEQKKLTSLVWSDIQEFAKSNISGYPTLGLGFRDRSNYGLISIGGVNNPGNPDASAEPWHQQLGGNHIFYPFFIEMKSVQQADNKPAPHPKPL